MVPRPVQERPGHDRRPTSATAGAARRSARSRSPSTFEGGWLDPSMTSTYPDIKYAWARDADGLVGQPGHDLVHGQLLDRRRLGQQGPGVRPADLPDRPGRHGQVDRGRRRPPVPQGRARRRPARTSSPRAARTPGRARASCPATSTSRRRSRTPSPPRSRPRPTTPAPVVDGDQGGHRRRRSASRPSVARGRGRRHGRPGSAAPGGRRHGRARPADAARSTRAPLGGARRLRADRRADAPVPGPQHRRDLLRRSSSACGSWNVRAGRVDFLGLDNYEDAARPTRSSIGRSRTRSTTPSSGCR